jgi:DNA-binding transcriptional regulator YiaG
MIKKAKKAKTAKAADSTMSGDAFKANLDKIGISQMGFSRLIGVGGRTVRSWISETYPVPKAVAALVNLMIKTKTAPEDLKI